MRSISWYHNQHLIHIDNINKYAHLRKTKDCNYLCYFKKRYSMIIYLLQIISCSNKSTAHKYITINNIIKQFIRTHSLSILVYNLTSDYKTVQLLSIPEKIYLGTRTEKLQNHRCLILLNRRRNVIALDELSQNFSPRAERKHPTEGTNSS